MNKLLGPNSISGPDNPTGPEYERLKDYIKSFLLTVTIYDGKTEEVIGETEIDYGKHDHRKYLGRLTFWATSNGHIVETKSK